MIYSFVRKLGGFALVSVASLSIHDYSLRQEPEANPVPIPSECGETFQCSSDWLSQAIGFNINSVTQKNIGGGFTTSSVRLHLQPTDANSTTPRSVVVKYYSEADANNWRKRIIMMALGGIEKLAKKEMFFYRHMRSRLEQTGIRTPKAYYLGIQDFGGRSPLLYILGWRTWFKSIMILEDLGQYKSFGGVGSSVSEEAAEIAAKNLAKFHSSFWDNTIALQLANPDLDLTPSAYNTFFGLTKNPLFSFPNSKDTLLERMNTWQEVLPIFKDETLRSNILSFTDHYSSLSTHQYTHNNETGPLFSHSTLLHGDYHTGNMFFDIDPETKIVTDSIIIDWQCYGVGHPSTEFAYFLSNLVEPDPARDHRLMKVYYNELKEQQVPVETYPFEVFEREVELRSMGLMAFNMINFKQTPEKAAEMRKEMAKEGVDADLMDKLATKNLKRFNYIYQKWEDENIFAQIEGPKGPEEKRFIKFPKLNIGSLLF
jgi:thiamine kinase-like enzyme